MLCSNNFVIGIRRWGETYHYTVSNIGRKWYTKKKEQISAAQIITGLFINTEIWQLTLSSVYPFRYPSVSKNDPTLTDEIFHGPTRIGSINHRKRSKFPTKVDLTQNLIYRVEAKCHVANINLWTKYIMVGRNDDLFITRRVTCSCLKTFQSTVKTLFVFPGPWSWWI